ncbi:MAG: TlpA family protein disulfide reductase [Acidimicrobiia bacterium]
MAADAQGPEAARPFAAPTLEAFRTLVDQDNLLVAAFGFRAVPNGVLVNADGEIDAVLTSGFDIRRPETRQLIEEWLAEEPNGAAIDVGVEELSAEALALFRAAGKAYRNGDREEAIHLLKQAMPLQPDNLIIRKQLWAIENPERFYDGDIDYDWQREQLAAGR